MNKRVLKTSIQTWLKRVLQHNRRWADRLERNNHNVFSTYFAGIKRWITTPIKRCSREREWISGVNTYTLSTGRISIGESGSLNDLKFWDRTLFLSKQIHTTIFGLSSRGSQLNYYNIALVLFVIVQTFFNRYLLPSTIQIWFIAAYYAMWRYHPFFQNFHIFFSPNFFELGKLNHISNREQITLYVENILWSFSCWSRDSQAYNQMTIECFINIQKCIELMKN